MLNVERHFRKFPINESNIVLYVEGSFVESLVRGRLYDLQRRGHSEPFDAFHEDADAVYELPSKRRDAAFNDLHAKYFERLGFAVPFVAGLREFPEFERCVGVIYVAQVVAAPDESVDLTRPRDTNAKREIGVRVRAERMLDTTRLETYLRHEWTHLNDLLDPDFRASERTTWDVRSATEEHLLRERYRTLWCATIDGRIERRGTQPGVTRDARRADFDRLYRRIPDDLRTRAFDRLWEGGRRPHPDLMALSESFETVRRFAETGVVVPTATNASERVAEPADGDPCPLCRFPTFRWVLPTDSDAPVSERIRADFPSWRPEEGVCERCYERYEMEVSAGSSAD